MAEHTPGPWYLAQMGYGSIVCAKAATLLPLRMGVIHLDIVARTDWNRGEEDEANARLIVAAPDLLAALKGVLRVADRKTDEFDAARAAIAKATIPDHHQSRRGR